MHLALGLFVRPLSLKDNLDYDVAPVVTQLNTISSIAGCIPIRLPSFRAVGKGAFSISTDKQTTILRHDYPLSSVSDRLFFIR